jgi:hypothetical protein
VISQSSNMVMVDISIVVICQEGGVEATVTILVILSFL